MAHVLADMVKQTSTSNGATTIALTGGALSPFRSFASALDDGDTTEVMVVSRNTGAWQAAVYRYTADTLTLVKFLSSSTGSVITFTNGTKDVYIAPLAETAEAPPLNMKVFAELDGTTDDTAGVIAAVAQAADEGRGLYWPEGTALTTATIPLFHTVRHSGPGIIQRGSDLFTIEPGAADTNVLYVAPAGDAANDGLSSSQPMTPQAAADAWVNHGPVLVGTWRMKFAAGNHPSVTLADALMGEFELVGVSTGDYRSAPTSIIDKALSGSSRNGVYFSGAGKRVLLKDLKAVDFINTTDAGFRTQNYTITAFENCHTFNCYLGYYILDHVQYSVIGGIIDGNNKAGLYGVDELFGVVRSYRTAGGTTNRTTIKGYQFGVHIKELCTGHFDYLQITDCDYGIEMTRHCTGNLADMDFRRNGVAVAVVRAAIINNSDITWNGQAILTGTSWAAGVATFVTGLDPLGRDAGIAVGDTFAITGVTPSGYNGTYIATAGTSGTTLKAALVSDPGAWVSGGRVDANTIHILPIDRSVLDNEFGGGNIEAELLAPYVGQTSRLKSSALTPVELTGTTTLTQIFYPLGGFLPGFFQAAGYRVNLFASGTYNVATTGATLNFRVGSNNIQVYTLPVSSGAWRLEALFIITSTGDFQYHSGALLLNGQDVQVKEGTRTLAFSTTEFNFGLWGQLADGADNITAKVGLLETTMM